MNHFGHRGGRYVGLALTALVACARSAPAPALDAPPAASSANVAPAASSATAIPEPSASPSASAPTSAIAAPDTPPAVELLAAIARDIEALGTKYPQLAAFRAATDFRAGDLAIDYAWHTHASTVRGGWRAGVPEPDADGIWFHVDLHDASSRSQIDTQPVVPKIDVLGKKLMILVLAGASASAAAGAVDAIVKRRAAEASTSEACGQPRDDQTPPATATAMDDILQRKPRSGRFTTEGWAQIAHHCPPCPPGASCKPCEEIVWLSPMFGAFKEPLARDQNLVLAVPDARKFPLMKRYRVTFVACRVSSDPSAPLTAELRGFVAIP